MPIVPSQTLNPVSTVYQNNAGVSPGAFGAGIAQATGQLAGSLMKAGDVTEQVYLKQRTEAANREITEGDLEYSKRASALLYGDGTAENQGFYATKGRNALTQAPEVAEQLRKLRADVLGKYNTPAVQQKLSLLLGKRELDHSNQMATYVTREKVEYDNTLDDARKNQAILDATAGASNPQTVADNVVRARDAVIMQSRRNGWDAEVTQANIMQAQTALYSAVIRGAIERKDANEVTRLMDLYAKPELMHQPVIDQLKNQQTQVVLAAEAQEAFDQYMVRGMDEDETIDAIRTELRDKPELRDEVERRVGNEFTRKVRAEKRFLDDSMSKVSNALYNGATTQAALDSLSSEEREAVEADTTALLEFHKIEQAVAEGKQYATHTDADAFNHYMGMSQRERSELSEREILGAKLQMTQSDWNRVWSLYQHDRAFIETGRSQIAPALQRADEFAYQMFKGDPRFKWGSSAPTKTQNARKQRLMSEMSLFIQEYFDANDKPPPPELVNKRILETATDMDYNPTFRFFQDFEILPGESLTHDQLDDMFSYGEMTPEQMDAVRVNPETMDPATVNQVAALLQTRGLEPTRRRVERVLGQVALESLSGQDRGDFLENYLREEGGRRNPNVPAAVLPQRPQAEFEGDVMGLQQFVEANEGRRRAVYNDSRGIPTVGVGFNLTRADAQQRINAVGADYTSIRTGLTTLTDDQIDRLFEMDLQDAANDARTLFPNFDELSEARQTALIDMTFNMGATTFGKFKQFRKHVAAGNWEAAAKAAENSRWYKQVKSRGPRIVGLIREG